MSEGLPKLAPYMPWDWEEDAYLAPKRAKKVIICIITG